MAILRTLEKIPGVVIAIGLYPIDLNFEFPVREKVAKPLRISNREAFVNCFDKQVIPPDTVECLRVVKEG